MLKDIFCYIKMSIRGELETDGGKKKIKYPFQKIAIVIALALWTITAINILYSESALSGEERIISAFGRQTYSDQSVHMENMVISAYLIVPKNLF